MSNPLPLFTVHRNPYSSFPSHMVLDDKSIPRGWGNSFEQATQIAEALTLQDTVNRGTLPLRIPMQVWELYPSAGAATLTRSGSILLWTAPEDLYYCSTDEQWKSRYDDAFVEILSVFDHWPTHPPCDMDPADSLTLRPLFLSPEWPIIGELHGD